MSGRTSFNSTMVRLKAQVLFPELRSYQSFNSTMVRLKDIRHDLCPFACLCFNSTMVRLKDFRPGYEHAHSYVSIPQWFD